MANNTRQYSIVINGVEQSVKAVDALLQKIDALDERISKLQKLNIDLGAVQNSVKGADSGSSKYDAAKSEAAAQKEVADQLALQNAENQKALQLLVQKKNETKEQVKIQQQIAQGVRDTNGEYANTLNGQRALLSEMKKQIGNMDIDDAATREFAEQINQVTEKIKEMEEAYGTFTRNVGNYKSAADGFQGFNITIGDTVRNFGSLREAAKTIKNEMMGIDTSTEEGRVQFEAYSQALHDVSVAQDQMSDAAQRATTSAKGLHDVLEMMEGLTAIAGIGQGISSLFGLDGSEIGEQIAKLQSLMTILQSIKTLQDQMERGVGGGGWIAKLWKGLDNPIASLKRLSAGLKTAKADTTALGAAGAVGAGGMSALSVATTTATAALKAFGKATVILFVLQLAVELIDALIEGFKKLGQWLFSFGDDSEKAARNIENVGMAAESTADAISSYNEALSRKVEVGAISSIQAAIMELENYDKELQKFTTDLYSTIDNLITGDDADKWQESLNGLSFKKTAEEAISAMNDMSAAMADMDKSSDDYKEAMTQYGRQIVVEMTSMSNLSREELAKFVEALNSDSYGRSALKMMIESLPEESRQSFEAMLNNFMNAADQMAARAAQLRGEVISSLKDLELRYLQLTDPSAAIRMRYETDREERKKLRDEGKITEELYQEYIAASKKAEKAELDSQNKRTATVKSGGRARVKATKSSGRARVSAAKDIASQLEAVEKRIQSDKIATMRDGLGKTLAQLDLERRNRIEQAEKLRKEHEKDAKFQEAINREILSINELYAKKEFDIKKKWAEEWEKYQDQIAEQYEQRRRANTRLAIDLQGNMDTNWLDKKTMDTEVEAIKNIVRRIAMADEEVQKIIRDSGVKDLLEKYLKNPTEEVLQQVVDILDKFNLELQTTLDMDGVPQFSFFEMFDDEEYSKSLKRIGELRSEIEKFDYQEIFSKSTEGIEQFNDEVLQQIDRLHQELLDMDIENADLEQLDQMKERISEIQSQLKELKFAEVDEEQIATFDAILKKYGELEAELDNLYNSVDLSKMALTDPYYLLSEWQTYYDKMYENQKKYAEKVKDLKMEEIELEEQSDIVDENNSYNKLIKDIEEKYKQHYQDIEDEYSRHLDEMQALDSKEVEDALKHAGEMLEIYGEDSEEYKQALADYRALIPEQVALVQKRDAELLQLEQWRNTQMEWFGELHNKKIYDIQSNSNAKRLKAENDFIRESQTATANYYSGLLNEWQMFQNKFVQKVSNLTDKSKNAWGIVDLSKYTKGINDLKAHFKRSVDDIEEMQKELVIKLANNEISLGDFNTAFNELEELKNEANETITTLTEMGRNKIGEFIESINQYIQAVGQGVQDLLSTVWDAQSAALDAQQEALEKANSELDKQLQKQQEITQRHADKINQIEDELSTARGDRRQHLIDALSAQIAAQRASLAAEQRIQKQKEANEKKQDALDKKRKEAQRKQDITSAIISTALATANGLATKPFVPVGIAMGALAAALGAAQVAIIASKHYAKGGLLEGPSHAQGGIPVGNTGVEVEGKEYIVNKYSTAKNLGLIEYINRSNKRLDMADIMEYFNSTASRSVRGVRNKFADGGQLPTLNDDIDVTSQLQTVIVNQDERPIWVSVKDINDSQARVRNVKVMAGLRNTD